MTTIKGYAKHLCVKSRDVLKQSEQSKIFGLEAQVPMIANKEVFLYWENTVTKRLQKMIASSLDSIPIKEVIVGNKPIVEVQISMKIINIISKMKSLSKPDVPMLSFYTYLSRCNCASRSLEFQ
jgi:hypothetical protein